MAAITDAIFFPKPFSGAPGENFTQFERQIRSSIVVNDVKDDVKPWFVHLRLTGGALMFYDQLPQETRNDFENSLTALRDRYENKNKIKKLSCTNLILQPGHLKILLKHQQTF